MNGVDYSKQLAKDREYYQDAVQKTKSAAEKRITDVENRSKHVTQKQRDNFIEDKAELESSYQKSLNNLKDKTKETIESTSSKFNKDTAAERQKFTAESMKKSKDFDQRLNDIKSSYQKAFASEKDRHVDLETTQKNKYSRNVEEISNKSTNQLKEYQDRLTGAGASLKDQYNREREQLVRSHEDHVTEVHKDSSKKRADLRERITADVQKSKEVQANDLDHQKKYTTDRLNSMQNKYQERVQGMAADYSERSNNLAKSQQQDAVRTNKEHQADLTNIKRDYNKSLRNIELENRRRDTGGGEFASVMERQQGLKDQSVQNSRVKHLNSELIEAKRHYQDKAISDQDNFNQTLKKESTEATARLERKANELNADKIVTVSKEREKAEFQVANREHQNRLDRSAYEQQIMLERNNAKIRHDKLKDNFNTALKSLEEKHQLSVEDVTKVTNKDKAEFTKRMQENRSEEIFAMKREFNKMMDSTVQNYEERLANYERENEYLKLSMGQKVQNIVDQTDRQMEAQRVIFEDRRNADIKNHQVMSDQRESQLKRSISELNVNFQKKIDKMQIQSDTKLKLITNDYETKLKELRALTSREIAQKDANHKVEQDRLKSAFEDEKARVVSSFENQISEIKKGHADQMQQMKDYKRLS